MEGSIDDYVDENDAENDDHDDVDNMELEEGDQQQSHEILYYRKTPCMDSVLDEEQTQLVAEQLSLMTINVFIHRKSSTRSIYHRKICSTSH